MSKMAIRTNMNSLNARRKIKNVDTKRTRASGRLSSGLRINSAADDAAGLGISEKMRAQIRGLEQASRNAQDAISLIQTAEGAISSIGSMVTRVRELVIQAANDTNTHTERLKIQQEIDQIMSEIDSIAQRTEFNTMPLLDGTFSSTINAAPPPSDMPIYYTLHSGRGSAGAMFNNPALQAIVNSPSFNFDFFNFADPMVNPIILDIMSGPGVMEVVMIDLAFGVLYHDSNFDNFIRNVLFEADGSVTDANLQHFISVMQAALRSEIAITESWLGVNLGSDEIIFDVDFDGRMIIGFPEPPFGLISILPDGGIDDPNNFNSVFFLDFLGRDGFDASWNMSDPVNGGINSANRPRIEGGESSQPPPNQGEGGQGRPLWFQVGANSSQGITLTINAMHTGALGLRNPLISVTGKTGEAISNQVVRLDDALSRASGQRAVLGAAQNRLEFTIQNLDISSENLSAAESRIRDADMAREMMALAKANVLQEAATTMLAQANQAPQTILQLLE